MKAVAQGVSQVRQYVLARTGSISRQVDFSLSKDIQEFQLLFVLNLTNPQAIPTRAGRCSILTAGFVVASHLKLMHFNSDWP
jgi:hypothetical protein